MELRLALGPRSRESSRSRSRGRYGHLATTNPSTKCRPLLSGFSRRVQTQSSRPGWRCSRSSSALTLTPYRAMCSAPSLSASFRPSGGVRWASTTRSRESRARWLRGALWLPIETVLDPACGAGTFLVETYRRHNESGLGHAEILERTFGNDLDPFAVHLASINVATREIFRGSNYPAIRLGDAFELKEGATLLDIAPAGGKRLEVELPRIDLAIANPPYQRQHPDEQQALLALQALFGSEVPLPEMTGGNLAAWFVLLAHGLLSEDGRMAFVLPVAVLQNDNLTAWREWVDSDGTWLFGTQSTTFGSATRVSHHALCSSSRLRRHRGR